MNTNTKPQPKQQQAAISHRDPETELQPKTIRHYQSPAPDEAPLYQDIQVAQEVVKNSLSESNAKLPVPAQKNEDPLNINGASDRLGFAILRYSLDKDTGKIATPFGLKDGVEFAWLAMNFSRKWEPPYDPRAAIQEKANCFSKNGIVPHGGKAPMSGPCEACPKAAWNGKEKPECAEIYKLLCFVNFTETDLDQLLSFCQAGGSLCAGELLSKDSKDKFVKAGLVEIDQFGFYALTKGAWFVAEEFLKGKY